MRVVSNPRATASNYSELAPQRQVAGSSAIINPSSNHSEKKMANMSDLPDDAEIAPTHHFVPIPPAHSAHYPQPAYSFPRGNGNFAAEQDIQMAQELSHDMQQGVGDAAPTSAPSNNSHGQNHAMDISSTPMGPGMGPPSNRQSFSGNPQSAVDVTPDQTMMGDGKRKRSKVSRACDECRRKKIRCDATDEDGSVKTCSNCSRVNQSCSFSRVPMKRGPSKGYIKELSERVQQVESLQMQLAGQPAAYRPSLGGESDYSPDEPYSAGRRNFSFSDQRNPFASHPRDRIPSTGGWSLASPTAAYRDTRGSIALAPDQQLADLNGPPIDYTKPFWSQEADEGGRAAKRQKTGSEDNIINSIGSVEQESLAVYFDKIHHVFPILPKHAKDIDTLLRACPARLTHAFAFVLGSAQGTPPSTSNFFKTYQEVEDHAWSQAKTNPKIRPTGENIIWLWTYVFMIFNAEKDLSKLYGAGLPQGTLLKLAHDLSTFISNDTLFSAESSEDSEFILARRAHYVVGILLTLHKVATGTDSSDSLPSHQIDSFDELNSILPDEAALLSRSCGVLAIIDTSIGLPTTWKTAPSFTAQNKALIEQHLSFAFGTARQQSDLDTLCKQIQSLVVILLARFTFTRSPVEILIPTLELVETLLQNTTASDIAPKYNPLDIHLFSLAVITLLEFTECVNGQFVAPALEGLAKIQRALEQIAKRINTETLANAEPMHWSSCLLRIIHAHGAPSVKSNGTAEKDPNIDPAMAGKSGEGPALLQGQAMSMYQAARVTDHDGQGDKIMDLKTGVVQVVDMSLLLKRGYLNVVAELCGV